MLPDYNIYPTEFTCKRFLALHLGNVSGRKAPIPRNLYRKDKDMKEFVVASILALTAVTPALAADFTGFRAGATIGMADENFLGDDIFTYGVNVGYDHAFGKLITGITAEYQESGKTGVGRDLSIVARIGSTVTDKALVYGLLGYTNQGIENSPIELDGVRVGLGVEYALTEKVFSNVEYRYSNYERGVELHQTLIGLGFRF